MPYTEEQFEKALEISAKQCGLDAHVSHLYKKSDMQTRADRIIGIFFRKGMPIKRSYMWCNSLDMTFFFLKDGTAVYTYSGYADNRDATEEQIIQAFKKANEMRLTMEQVLVSLKGKNDEKTLKDIIRDIVERNESEWIKPEDKLPENNQRVTVITEDRYVAGHYCICGGMYTRNIDEWYAEAYGCADNFRVIAWKQLDEKQMGGTNNG